jgi:hypothetical protein
VPLRKKLRRKNSFFEWFFAKTAHELLTIVAEIEGALLLSASLLNYGCKKFDNTGCRSTFLLAL